MKRLLTTLTSLFLLSQQGEASEVKHPPLRVIPSVVPGRNESFVVKRAPNSQTEDLDDYAKRLLETHSARLEEAQLLFNAWLEAALRELTMVNSRLYPNRDQLLLATAVLYRDLLLRFNPKAAEELTAKITEAAETLPPHKFLLVSQFHGVPWPKHLKGKAKPTYLILKWLGNVDNERLLFRKYYQHTKAKNVAALRTFLQTSTDPFFVAVRPAFAVLSPVPQATTAAPKKNGTIELSPLGKELADALSMFSFDIVGVTLSYFSLNVVTKNHELFLSRGLRSDSFKPMRDFLANRSEFLSYQEVLDLVGRRVAEEARLALKTNYYKDRQLFLLATAIVAKQLTKALHLHQINVHALIENTAFHPFVTLSVHVKLPAVEVRLTPMRLPPISRETWANYLPAKGDKVPVNTWMTVAFLNWLKSAQDDLQGPFKNCYDLLDRLRDVAVLDLTQLKKEGLKDPDFARLYLRVLRVAAGETVNDDEQP